MVLTTPTDYVGKHRTDDLTLGELIEAWCRISLHRPRHAA